MERNYQNLFDQISMPEDRAQALRTRLTSHCSPIEQEVIPMKETKKLRRPAVALVAALLICALSVTAFAAGDKIVNSLYSFMTGGTIEEGITASGDPYAAGSVDTGEAISPVEIRDGRLYLTANGQNLDITGQCSYTKPYLYECTGSDGLRHVFAVGGDMDAIGWAEFIWDSQGLPTAGSSVLGTSGGQEDAPWLQKAMEELALPWAGF